MHSKPRRGWSGSEAGCLGQAAALRAACSSAAHCGPTGLRGKPLAFPHEFLVLTGHLDFNAVSVCLCRVRQSLRDRHAIHKYVARRRTPVRNPVLWPTCMLRLNRYFIDLSGDRAWREREMSGIRATTVET